MDNWELIHAKIDGSLSEEGQVLFEKRIEKSEDFREEYEISCAALLVKEAAAEEELYRHLAQIKQEKGTRFSWTRIAAGLAAALALILVSVSLWSTSGDSQTLFLAEYKQPLNPVKRDSSSVAKPASKLFFSQEPEQYEHWYSAQSNPSLEAKIYYGHALIQQEKWEKAQVHWLSLSKDYKAASWFEAMACLGDNQLKEAKEILLPIAKTRSIPIMNGHVYC